MPLKIGHCDVDTSSIREEIKPLKAFGADFPVAWIIDCWILITWVQIHLHDTMAEGGHQHPPHKFIKKCKSATFALDGMLYTISKSFFFLDVPLLMALSCLRVNIPLSMALSCFRLDVPLLDVPLLMALSCFRVDVPMLMALACFCVDVPLLMALSCFRMDIPPLMAIFCIVSPYSFYVVLIMHF